MGLIENLSDRWLKYFNSSNPKSELVKMTKQDYLIYNKFNNDQQRNDYIIKNIEILHQKILAVNNKVVAQKKSLLLESSKELTNMEKLKNLIAQLVKKMKNSFTAIIYTCLAISILAILTLMLMNKKLDKFIRITSDFFYVTKEAISETFYKSMGALLSLSVTDFLEEFTNCIQDYLNEVKKLIALTKREGLDVPITILLASIGLMMLALTFKYYQLYKDANGNTFDPNRGA